MSSPDYSDGLYGEGTYDGFGLFGGTTPGQPSLPLEIPFADAELSFIEESPPGLYPENQDSNFGLFRKIFTDRVQVLIGQQLEIYNTRFVDTVAPEFIDVWEREVGLPVAPFTVSLARRKIDVGNRLAKGPFTVERRKKTVEHFIWDAVDIQNPDFEGSTAHWTGVPFSGGVLNDFSYGTPWAIYGQYANHFSSTHPNNSTPLTAGVIYSTGVNAIPVAPGQEITVSCYYRVILPSDQAGDMGRFHLVWYNAAGATISTTTVDFNEKVEIVPETGQSITEKRIEVTGVAPAGAAFFAPQVVINSSVPNDTVEFQLDHFEVQRANVSDTFLPTYYSIRENLPQGKNLLSNGNFETNTAGWTPANTALAQILNTSVPSKYGDALMRSLGSAATTQRFISSVAISGATLGRNYTASIWAKGTGSTIGKVFSVGIEEQGGASGNQSSTSGNALTAQYQRFSLTRMLLQNDRTQINVFFDLLGGAINDVVFVDGAQLELGASPTDFIDPQVGNSYEVRVTDALPIDVVGLQRELKRITPASLPFTVVSSATI